MKKTLEYLNNKKKNHQPIVMVTAYDFPTAKIEEEAGVDSILVGDSVGTNILGYMSEQEVTISDMMHHVGAVGRAIKEAYLIADMPFGTHDTKSKATENAKLLMSQGADCIKIEGWSDKCEIVEDLTRKGIAVCSHIGYNPQIHGSKPRTFGKEADQAIELIESARLLQESGAKLIVLEKVPVEIAGIISENLVIPTIGIGSGDQCDGQVLVVTDILGMTLNTFKHARRYLDYHTLSLGAFRNYKDDVENRRFPSEENTWHMKPEELESVRKELKVKSEK
jgi:3-methyl-2-oxobutanoate hydroxymethyltransferase